MTMTDPLGDMLTRIRNAQRARMSVVSSPASRLRTNVLAWSARPVRCGGTDPRLREKGHMLTSAGSLPLHA